jgi:hypothetical protein
MSERTASWPEASQRQFSAWANDNDRTEAAAYGVALASVEAELNVFAVSRAYRRSGADYLVAAKDAVDLENAYRLEISGVDSGDSATVARRVRRKLAQLRAVKDDDSIIACVVGFKERAVVIQTQQGE